MITKTGINENGNNLHYYFNYSNDTSEFVYPHKEGIDLLTNKVIRSGEKITLTGWDFVIVEEN